MKQLLFMSVVMFAGAAGAVVHPFYGVLLYYGLAVLKPQDLWSWALPPGVRWSLMAVMITLGGLALSMPRRRWQVQWNGLAWGLVLLAVLIGLSALTALDPSLSRFWVIEYAKIFFMLFLATMLIDRLEYVHQLVWVVFGALTYVAWEMNVRYLLDQGRDIYQYGFAGLDNNGAGLLMAMGLPLAYARFRLARSWWLKAGCAAAGVLLLHALMLSYSRGAMLSAIAGMAWVAACHRPRWHAAGMVLAMVLVVGVLAGPQVRQRFASIQQYESDRSAQSRLASWSAAWRMAWDHPFTGVGVRNANQFGHNYGTDFQGRTIHNQYLQTAADCGIITLAVYLVLCGWSLARLQRVRRMTGNGHGGRDGDLSHDRLLLYHDRPTAVVSLGLQGSLVIFYVGGMFLSLELFELPWLMMALAGSLPVLVRRQACAQQEQAGADPPVEEQEQTGQPTGPVAPSPGPRAAAGTIGLLGGLSR